MPPSEWVATGPAATELEAARCAPPALVDADVTNRAVAVLAAGSRTFRLASFFLPPAVRARAAVVYAFCRRVDDAVDEAPDPSSAAAAVQRLRFELIQPGADPVMLAFTAIVADNPVGLAAARSLIDGVASDLELVRTPNDRELIRYAYAVAGTVGLLMCGVLGVTDRRALAHAIDLGIAMQITNICRDVAQDAQMGRVYLPARRLSSVSVTQAGLVDGRALPGALVPVARDLLALADRYYRSADAGMRFLPLRTRVAIVVASRMYRQIGVKLLRRGGDPLEGRTVVGAIEKAWVVARALLSCLSPRILGLLPAEPHDARLHDALDGLAGADCSANTQAPRRQPAERRAELTAPQD